MVHGQRQKSQSCVNFQFSPGAGGVARGGGGQVGKGKER